VVRAAVESRYGADGVRDLDLFIAKAQVSLIPVDEEQAALARRAFRKYGKGPHPAGLNFGDCFSYASSTALEEPVLFKGNDFPQTDAHCHSASIATVASKE
jgi:ribonuclease VapC